MVSIASINWQTNIINLYIAKRCNLTYNIIMSTYVVTAIEANRFQIVNFEDSASPEGVYEVLYTKNRDYMSCNCRGFKMQKDKTEHRHCKIVRFWMEQGKPEGSAIWEENSKYNINRFVDV